MIYKNGIATVIKKTFEGKILNAIFLNKVWFFT